MHPSLTPFATRQPPAPRVFAATSGRRCGAAAVGFLLFAVGPQAAVAQGAAESPREQQAEAVDEPGKDLSGWLLDGRGVLPVPIILTDPALGTGGGVAIVRFRRPAGSAPGPEAESGGEGVQPHVFGVGAFRTSNGSKGAGAGALLRFRDDAFRYRGIVGKVSMNLEYHGADALQWLSREVAYNIDGVVSSQGMQFRTGHERLYIGANWIYMDLDVEFDVDSDETLFQDHALSRRNSGLGLSLEYDSRDSSFTPARGWFGAVDGTWYHDAIGSDSDFRLYRGRTFAYFPLGEDIVIAGRADLRLAQGDVPFYRLPYIDLRGIGAARYQDTRALVAETEVRWNFSTRWALVGFAGMGRTWGRHGDFGEATSRASKGAGIRYLLSRELGLYAGVDHAWGPEEGTYYVQVGSAWR